jgi:archaellum biogenesis protein FlaJ (TadC family)
MLTDTTADVYSALGLTLIAGLVAHLGILAIEHLTPSPTLHHELARRTLTRGAYARVYWIGAVIGGAVLPLAIAAIAWSTPVVAVVAAGLALVGTFAWQYVWTEAGQSVPNS